MKVAYNRDGVLFKGVYDAAQKVGIHFFGIFCDGFSGIGTAQEIKSLYSELKLEIPDTVIAIAKDEVMGEYVKNVLGAKSYPTLVSYYDGKVSFNTNGYLDDSQLDDFYDCGFENRIDFKSLKNNDGEYLLQTIRTDKDVENSFSKDNLPFSDNSFSNLGQGAKWFVIASLPFEITINNFKII